MTYISGYGWNKRIEKSLDPAGLEARATMRRPQKRLACTIFAYFCKLVLVLPVVSLNLILFLKYW